MKRFNLFLLMLTLGLLPLVVSAQTASLTTTFASGNAFAGNMFDVTVSEPVCINSFDVNILSIFPQETITVYYKTGTYAGSETTPGAWTTLGSALVTPQGVDTPTPAAIGGITLSPGTVYGMYVSLSSYVGNDENEMRYTDGGPNVYSDGTMSLTTGTGMGFPEFGQTFFPREWNGTIHYTVGACGSIEEPEEEPETEAPAPPFMFADGRINKYDAAAPVAVYPHFVNGEAGLIIYDADGTELLVVAPEQLANAPENPETNLLIAEATNVALYRLTDGEWQVNASQYNGKTYVLIFDAPYANTDYTSFED